MRETRGLRCRETIFYLLRLRRSARPLLVINNRRFDNDIVFVVWRFILCFLLLFLSGFPRAKEEGGKSEDKLVNKGGSGLE